MAHLTWAISLQDQVALGYVKLTAEARLERRHFTVPDQAVFTAIYEPTGKLFFFSNLKNYCSSAFLILIVD